MHKLVVAELGSGAFLTQVPGSGMEKLGSGIRNTDCRTGTFNRKHYTREVLTLDALAILHVMIGTV
jgi:hypothetical protein